MKLPGGTQTLFVIRDHTRNSVFEIRKIFGELEGKLHQIDNTDTRKRRIPHVDQDIVVRVQTGDAGDLSIQKVISKELDAVGIEDAIKSTKDPLVGSLAAYMVFGKQPEFLDIQKDAS